LEFASVVRTLGSQNSNRCFHRICCLFGYYANGCTPTGIVQRKGNIKIADDKVQTSLIVAVSKIYVIV
jgi:hypothetical protein